jgi:hypothetical protein
MNEANHARTGPVASPENVPNKSSDVSRLEDSMRREKVLDETPELPDDFYEHMSQGNPYRVKMPPGTLPANRLNKE